MSLLLQEGSRETILQRKQRCEITLRQIQGDNLGEKTRMRDNPKTNPGRQPCRENKDGRNS
jgi:hypothetical protein